ncbi:hypothetical protein [Flavobacterium sp. FlaQc-48]|uniref:hypothetical protein n=1 Tax=Flavobacterium sp. FlaQc-48 TaxID=3374181 RepID=UPI0037565735
MRKIILSLLVFILLAASYLFYDFKTKKENFGYLNPKTEKKNSKILYPKDLDPKSFIALFTENYNKDSKLNFVTMTGDFPYNWVKPNDVHYLISVMRSKEKCCGYMNTFSSFISSENGEVGGFAIIFLNSYISKTKINMGLNCNPGTNIESVRKIEKWYQKNH